MNEQYNQAIICMTRVIVMNNAGAAARVLADSGYDKKSYIDACEIELSLLQVFLCDKAMYFRIMGMIPWNHGEKHTNAPEIKGKLIALSNLSENTENKGDWWNHILIKMNP